jgi:hypothetical protein
MDNLTPNDLSHLSDEEFNALAPQGYHATGSAEPLSPAAQAVLRADAAARCLSEWDSVNDPPCHPSDGGWNGCIRCVNRSAVAAALRAAADQPYEVPAYFRGDDYWRYRDGVDAERNRLLAIAAELDNNSTHK